MSFRRPGLGRVRLYGLALLPTFDVQSPFGPGSATFTVFGFGVRLVL